MANAGVICNNTTAEYCHEKDQDKTKQNGDSEMTDGRDEGMMPLPRALPRRILVPLIGKIEAGRCSRHEAVDVPVDECYMPS